MLDCRAVALPTTERIVLNSVAEIEKEELEFLVLCHLVWKGNLT